MRVLVLSKYDTMAASSRHRFLAYAPYLAAHGIDLTFSPLFGNDYLREKLQKNRTSIVAVVRGYARRLRALLTVKDFDLLLIQYELLPYLPAWFEQLLTLLKVPYVVDYDDAIFHMYDAHERAAVRSLLSNKIPTVMRGARAVIAGSEYLAERALQHNVNSHLIPTVIDLDRYRVKAPQTDSAAPFTVGWIGSPSTVRHLVLVEDAMRKLAEEGPVRCVVVGAEPPVWPGIEVLSYPWSEETEVQHLLACHVGIMPLYDEPFTRGKCAFKLIQYMGCGLPVVASPVGANNDVVTAETGLFANTSEEWLRAFRLLRDNSETRARLGAAGRIRCEEHYSLQSQQAHLAQILSA